MKSWKMVIFFFLEWVRKSLDIHIRPYANRKKKQYFLRRPQIVHAFSNIPFLDSCNGAQTGHGTPERHHNLKKAEWAADVWTSKNRPTPDRKKKVFFFRVDPE